MPAVPPLPSDLIPDDDLTTRALTQCEAHATSEISGQLTIEPLTRETAFDEQQLRFVFEQVMLVWRRMGDFEIVLDENDAPIGFVDVAEQAAAAWDDISPDDVLKLAIESGWVGGTAARVGPLVRVVDGTCAAIDVLDPGQPIRIHLRVTVNPASRKVTAVVPTPRPLEGS